ncbi:MAG: RIP metalloprotease RseP [Chlorobi bacterium]|nr:RIP metalloprotease RseP [Chlorobiota bacterium]
MGIKETLIVVLQFLLSISILVVLHELGHFLMAKLFKTRVEKFYLFFNPKFSLFKKKIGETEYGIGWLPLGGYVKIAGMIDESMDKEYLKSEPKPWEFRSKPAWQRLLIMLGGVMVNLLLAIIIYIGIAYTWGEAKIPLDSLKDGLWIQSSILKEAGLRSGDRIVRIDDREVRYLEDILKPPTPPLLTARTITVVRDGKEQVVEMPEDFINRLVDNKKREGLVGPRIPFIINRVVPGSPNEGADLRKGDEIVSVDGRPVKYMDEVIDYLQTRKGQQVEVGIKRDGEIREITLNVSDEGKIGVETYLDEDLIKERGLFKVEYEKYGFWESIGKGWQTAKQTLTGYLTQLKLLFNPSTGAYKSVGGFVTMAKIFPTSWDWQAFWKITAFLSIMLAVLNILPIPALDGGHAMFTLFEMVTGRKPSDKFLEKAQIVGFIILLTLLIYANGNDLLRLFGK